VQARDAAAPVVPTARALLAPAVRAVAPALVLAVELVRKAPTATGRIVAVQLPGAADRLATVIRAVAQALPAVVDLPRAAGATPEIGVKRPIAPTVIARPARTARTQRPLTAVRSPDGPEVALNDRVPGRSPVGPIVGAAKLAATKLVATQPAATGGSPAVARVAATDPPVRRGGPIRAPAQAVDPHPTVRTPPAAAATPAPPVPAMP
jgi:hypothetical protein